MIKETNKKNNKAHCLVWKVPTGWNDLPVEEREYCSRCGHPGIENEKCIYCGKKIEHEDYNGELLYEK